MVNWSQIEQKQIEEQKIIDAEISRAKRYFHLAVKIADAEELYPKPIVKGLFKKKQYCPLCHTLLAKTDTASFITDGGMWLKYAYYHCQCDYEWVSLMGSDAGSMI